MGGRGAYYGRSFYVTPSGHAKTSVKKRDNKATQSAEQAKTEAIQTLKSKLGPAIKEFPFYWYRQGTDGKEFDLKDVQYVLPTKAKEAESEEESIKAVGGLDRTNGSCASAAMAYIMRRAGYDVTDFRGGQSMEVFSQKATGLAIANLDGVEGYMEKSKSSFTATHRLLKHVEPGKQYLLRTGKHAAIVKRVDDRYMFLELQDKPERNGWKEMGGAEHAIDVNFALNYRFGATKTRRSEIPSTLVNVDSLIKSKQFQQLAGFFNTHGLKQKKGAGGHVK